MSDVTFNVEPIIVEFPTEGLPAGAFVPKSDYASKGDVLAGTATASTPAAVAVGANDTVLTADSSTATGWAAKTLTALGAVVNSAFLAANQLVYSTAAGTVAYLTVGASTLVGRGAAGNLDALTPAAANTILGTVIKTDYNANTVLAATADDTPAPVTMSEGTFLGRLVGGAIAALTVVQSWVTLAAVDPSTLTEGQYIAYETRVAAGLTPERLYYETTGGVWALADATTTGAGADAKLAIALSANLLMLDGWYFTSAGMRDGAFVAGQITYMSTTAGKVAAKGSVGQAAGNALRDVGHWDLTTTNVMRFRPSSTWARFAAP